MGCCSSAPADGRQADHERTTDAAPSASPEPPTGTAASEGQSATGARDGHSQHSRAAAKYAVPPADGHGSTANGAWSGDKEKGANGAAKHGPSAGWTDPEPNHGAAVSHHAHADCPPAGVRAPSSCTANPFNGLEIGFPGTGREADLPEGLSSVIRGMQRKGLLTTPDRSGPEADPEARTVDTVQVKITDLTLPLILAEPALLSHFMSLLLKQFAEENIIFLKTLGDLRQLAADANSDRDALTAAGGAAGAGPPAFPSRLHSHMQDQSESARKIRELESFLVSEFLMPNSPMEINISAPMRKAFLSQFSSLDHDVMEKLALFDPPEREVVQLLTKNFLYSFKDSLAHQLHTNTVPVHLHSRSATLSQGALAMSPLARNLPGSSNDEEQQPAESSVRVRTPGGSTSATPALRPLAPLAACSGAQRASERATPTGSPILSPASEPTPSPPSARIYRLVIVGGGFCGTYLVRSLVQHPNLHITLIDNKQYFEYTASIPKVLLNPVHHKNVTFSHEEQLKQQYKRSEYTSAGKGAQAEADPEPCPVPHRFVCGEVSAVSPSAVHVGLERVPYDYLVVCTGLHYPSGLKNTGASVTDEYRGKQLMLEFRRIRDAESCLVIGGGSTGVEIAGEIRDAFPNKPIEIVAASSRFLHRSPPNVHDAIVRQLDAKNIKWTVDEAVIKYDERRQCFLTSKNRELRAGKAFWCGGPVPLTGFMQTHFADQLEHGYIRVNESLQWEGYSNMFAGGDCCNMREEKMACRAMEHAHILTHNLREMVAARLAEEKADTATPIRKPRLLAYRPPQGPDLQLISIGTDQGVVVRHSSVLSGRVVGLKDEAESITMEEIKQGLDVAYYPYRVLNLMDLDSVESALSRGEKARMPTVPPPGYDKSMWEVNAE